jgi:SAM-dependent methyltransferase
VSDHAARANSFGPAAEIYERGRPTYPAEALDWLLPAGNPRVIDLGAGTGKLTRQIRARGLQVSAVDPSEGMLARLTAAVPGVPTLLGAAESIPLPTGSADVVLVAQAWHWVDPVRALPEVARVLAPGGRLGLIWNTRDQSSDWIRRLDEVIGNEDRGRQTTIGAPFGPTETHHVRWNHVIGPEQLLDLVASRSGVILLEADERAGLLAEVRRLMATHPSLVGRTEFEMPYVTVCARASLPGRSRLASAGRRRRGASHGGGQGGDDVVPRAGCRGSAPGHVAVGGDAVPVGPLGLADDLAHDRDAEGAGGHVGGFPPRSAGPVIATPSRASLPPPPRRVHRRAPGGRRHGRPRRRHISCAGATRDLPHPGDPAALDRRPLRGLAHRRSRPAVAASGG